MNFSAPNCGAWTFGKSALYPVYVLAREELGDQSPLTENFLQFRRVLRKNPHQNFFHSKLLKIPPPPRAFLSKFNVKIKENFDFMRYNSGRSY